MTDLHHRLARNLLSLLAIVLAAGAMPLMAAPPAAPGGHHAIGYGGSNRGGYPALQQRVGVPNRKKPDPLALAVAILPNPFRAATQFEFVTRVDERARVRVFTADGKQVRELTGQSTGLQRLTWDGRDHKGRRLPAGIYLYRIEAGARIASGRITLVR